MAQCTSQNAREYGFESYICSVGFESQHPEFLQHPAPQQGAQILAPCAPSSPAPLPTLSVGGWVGGREGGRVEGWVGFRDGKENQTQRDGGRGREGGREGERTGGRAREGRRVEGTEVLSRREREVSGGRAGERVKKRHSFIPLATQAAARPDYCMPSLKQLCPHEGQNL